MRHVGNESTGVNYAFTKETGAPSTNVTYTIQANGKRAKTFLALGIEKTDNEVVFQRNTKFRVKSVMTNGATAQIELIEL